MRATIQRDRVSALVKSDPKKALAQARKIDDPWFRAQALSWVARFTNGDPDAIAREAERAAANCRDNYQKSAVRAWEIVALAERGFKSRARKSLNQAIELARSIQPASSRSEALFSLLQAAFALGARDANLTYQVLISSCGAEHHWRCKRAVRDSERLISGELEPRPFFW